MGLFDWLRGKKPDHAYTNRTARWMHDKIVEHAKDGDAYAIAQAAAALKGEAPMAFGLLLTDVLGDERELVIEEAIAALRTLLPKLSDDAFDQVVPIIRSAKLDVAVEGRRTQRELKKERKAEEIVTKLRTSIAEAGTADLFKGFVALRAGYHDAFGVAVPAAVRTELTELARERVVTAIPKLSDDECDELLELVEAPVFGIDVGARRDQLLANRRHVRETAIAAAVAAEPRNPELEAALAADLDDAAAFSVFADYLGDHGHPRGELIELALRAEHDATLAPEVDRVIAEHAETLLGPLAKFTTRVDYNRDPAFTWRRGFIDRARLSYDENCRERGQPRTSLVELMHALFGHPSGRYLRALALGINGLGSETTLDDAIAALVAAPPPHLRELLLGDFTQDQVEMSWYQLGNVEPIWPALPRLAKLVVRGGSFELGTIAAPGLEHAEFHTGGLTVVNAKAIAKATWPKLRHLDVWFGDPNYGGETTIADARPIMMRADLPALVHLGLKNCEYTDEVCAVLADMPLAAQLESLDLSLGTLGRGALELARLAPRLPKLAKLDVSDNFLVAEEIAALRAAFPFVHVGTQRDEQEYGERVVAVGE